MRTTLECLAHHAEPVSRREFRIFAAVGIMLALATAGAFVYAEHVDAETARTPATWHQDAPAMPEAF